MPVPPLWLVAAGGATLFLLFVFQMLLGYKKIPIKGAAWRIWHKRVAWLIVVLGVVHGTAALAFVFGW